MAKRESQASTSRVSERTPEESDRGSLIDLGDQFPTYINCREEDVIETLYAPCLQRSVRYVRGAGYFRSSVFRLMTEDLLNFCIAGGRISLVTSTQMDLSDYDNAVEAYRSDGFEAELSELLADPETVDPTRMLCALIGNGVLDMWVAVMRTDIYHEKKGFFEDSIGHVVAFDGSGNETLSALKPFDSGNAESFNVSVSWKSEVWASYGIKWTTELKRAVSQDPTLTFPVVAIQDLDRDFVHHHDIDLVLESHRQAARKRQKMLRNKWDETFGEPTSPQSSPRSGVDLPPLRKHQAKGLKEWAKAGHCGILEHATGSGKTITALTAIDEHRAAGGKTIILVPGEPLLNQWISEIKSRLGIAADGLGGGQKDGLKALDEMRIDDDSPGVIVAILKSFSKPTATDRLRLALKHSEGEVLLVVDECHRLGAPSYRPILNLAPHHRLGLSATPEREGDADGTAALLGFLGPVVDTYSLQDALDDGHLSPYEYAIHPVELLASEQADYDDLRKKIRVAYGKWGRRGDPPEYLEGLVHAARRLIRSASRKIDVAAEILRGHFTEGQHWLVYCESEAMMSSVAQLVKSSGIRPYTYWSGMNGFQRKQALAHFTAHGGVMLAIRCLDEGVDIPAVSHGIVLSSSKTKREFIQRRGRLLRKSGLGKVAFIHDAFALPSDGGAETGFVMDEVLRAREFAASARNSLAVSAILDRIIAAHGIVDDEQLPNREGESTDGEV
jgi:superfamily II DNA or RNA helicase